MEKIAELKDGSEVVIRDMAENDLERSLAFFQALPEEDRTYLRRDVTSRDNVARRILDMKAGRVLRLVAAVNDEFVADGGLELEPEGWKEHVAELRLIVARPYQGKGLGLVMARELYHLAAARRVEEILVRFMAPQVGARNIFTSLGFHEDAVIPDYVKDMGGHKQDLVVMRCNLEALWQELEIHFRRSEWQRMH
jgi:L-amino acid N-acyltransferase YncA